MADQGGEPSTAPSFSQRSVRDARSTPLVSTPSSHDAGTRAAVVRTNATATGAQNRTGPPGTWTTRPVAVRSPPAAGRAVSMVSTSAFGEAPVRVRPYAVPAPVRTRTPSRAPLRRRFRAVRLRRTPARRSGVSGSSSAARCRTSVRSGSVMSALPRSAEQVAQSGNGLRVLALHIADRATQELSGLHLGLIDVMSQHHDSPLPQRQGPQGTEHRVVVRRVKDCLDRQVRRRTLRPATTPPPRGGRVYECPVHVAVEVVGLSDRRPTRGEARQDVLDEILP